MKFILKNIIGVIIIMLVIIAYSEEQFLIAKLILTKLFSL